MDISKIKASQDVKTIEEIYIEMREAMDSEQVNSPARYNQYNIETIEMMRRIWGNDAVRLWAEMTAFKYRMRLGHKDETDLELAKEKWYLAYSKTTFNDENRN